MTLQNVSPEDVARRQRLRRELTGLERTALNGYLSMLKAVHTYVEGTAIDEYFKTGLTQAYERVLDAVMYGYPAAVFEGWPDIAVSKDHAFMCWVPRAGDEHCPKDCDCWCHDS